MSVPNIAQFFKSTVTIQLKDGHKFQGKLKSIDYKQQTIELIQVQDLGNTNDKTSIPHDKKIQNRIFQSNKLYMQPKKYVKNDFWDPISQQGQQKPKPKYQEKKRQNNYNKERNYRNDRNDRNYNNNNYRNEDKRDNNNQRYYKKKQYEKRQPNNDRDEGQYR